MFIHIQNLTKKVKIQRKKKTKYLKSKGIYCRSLSLFHSLVSAFLDNCTTLNGFAESRVELREYKTFLEGHWKAH